MKVYTCLLCFASEGKTPVILTDTSGVLPQSEISDTSPESLIQAIDILYYCSGVDRNWYPQFCQAGVYEFRSDRNKEIFICYSVYLPSKMELSNQSYKWSALAELDENSKIYNVVRHIYSTRKL